MTPRDDLPRDAHLQAALRHAPDHDLAPPPALAERILAQARSMQPPPTAAAPGWAERWFGWMSKPLAAGAVGSLLVAGLVGVMWREGPPPDNLSGADRPSAGVPAAPPAAPAPVAAPMPAPAVQAPATRQAPPAAAPAPAPAPAPAAVGKDKARSDHVSDRERARAVPAPAAEEAKAIESTAAPPPPPPAAMPAPAAAPALALPQRQRPAAAPANRAEARDTAAAGAAAFDALVPPLLELGGDADQALRARLQALQRRVSGPWAEAPPLAAGSGEAIVSADGRVLGRLLIDGGMLLWQGSDGQAWRAPLSPP